MVAVSLDMFRLECKKQSGSPSQLEEKAISGPDVCFLVNQNEHDELNL